jgi:glyoxylase-like metal-dependent hydrolase (beta-lactamase superfamily II)
VPQPELTEIVEGRIWASERPVWFGGVRLRVRTSVVRLDDRHLLVHSPAGPSDGLVKAMAELGEVSWLVVPNRFHHLGTPAAAAAFPAAKVVAPRSAAARNPELRIDVEIGDPKFTEAVPEFALFPLEGAPFWDETLLYHRPTETLFGADVVLRADETDHWSWRFAARVTGCFKRVRVPPDGRKKIADKEAASRSLRALQALPIKRLIVGHGGVIDEAPLAQLLEAWRLEGVG